ncbi:Hypothetical_protein [Hexamita inflata]|uniref:Hypothetical_protein n=1 Tax=Hexamita inflata TaxID=28002 RepID=A0AA86PL38_9EUKA|nr:Hypothetical protein HINF_LOCUS25165 [Hexamita inflata]
MICYDQYWDCLYAKNDGYECTYYEGLKLYCFNTDTNSAKDTAWWVWLIIALGIFTLVSFITFGIYFCKKNNVKIQKIKDVNQEEQSYLVYQPPEQRQNVQPVISQKYIPQPVYQPTGIPNYNSQNGVYQQNIIYPLPQQYFITFFGIQE